MPKLRHPKPAAKPLSAHPELGNDRWQRQADAAAWATASGMHPSLYLGAIEPIPIPADLRAQLREAGKAMAKEPTDIRADALLRLAHQAAYGTQPDWPPPEPAPAPVVADWWADTTPPPAAPCTAAVMHFVAEAHQALADSAWTPEDDGECPRSAAGAAAGGDWW